MSAYPIEVYLYRHLIYFVVVKNPLALVSRTRS